MKILKKPPAHFIGEVHCSLQSFTPQRDILVYLANAGENDISFLTTRLFPLPDISS